MIEKNAAHKEAALKSILEKYRGTSAATQRDRLLAALSRYPITTLEARRSLDILHPAGRIRELRHIGHAIATLWVQRATDVGVFHRVGQYILMRGNADGMAT